MIVGGKYSFDYTVSNLSELNTVLANSDATLSGKTIGFLGGADYGTSRINFTSRSFTRPLTLAAVRPGPTLAGLLLTNATNVVVSGMILQRDWQSGDTTGTSVVDIGGSSGCSLEFCEISSTPVGSSFQTAATEQILTGVGSASNTSLTSITVLNCYIHDCYRSVCLFGGSFIVVNNRFEDCFQNFGEFHNWTRLIYNNNTGQGIWAHGGVIGLVGPNNPGGSPTLYPYDWGDPHSSLLGTGATTTCGPMQMLGNKLVSGTNRLDDGTVLGSTYGGVASGPKFNDTSDAMLYNDVEMAGNYFCSTDSIGMEVAFCNDLSFHHNLLVTDPLTNVNNTTPNIAYHDVGTNCKAWKNIYPSYAIGSQTSIVGGPNGVNDTWYQDSYDNLVARQVISPITTSDLQSYNQLFDGPTFSGITVDNIESIFTPKTGGVIETRRLGPRYYQDAYSKPITTTANGVSLTTVNFDGSTTYDLVTDAANPLLDMTNTDEITFIFGLAPTTTTDSYVLSATASGIELRRLPGAATTTSGGSIQFRLKDGSGNVVVDVTSSMRLSTADSVTVWAISVKLSTYQVRIMKGPYLDGLFNVATWTGAAYSVNRLNMSLMALTTGGGGSKLGGNVTFFWVMDTFLDLNTVSVLNNIVALDGLPPDYGAGGANVYGTQPRAYLTGTAATWNSSSGLNLGSASNKFIITGAVT
jgi:hypothetical protein